MRIRLIVLLFAVVVAAWPQTMGHSGMSHVVPSGGGGLGVLIAKSHSPGCPATVIGTYTGDAASMTDNATVYTDRAQCYN